MQTYTIPPNVATVTIEATGAGGGVDPCGANQAGLGGTISTTINVVAGQTLYMFVGGVGSVGTGGYNGGGNGYTNINNGCVGGGGGGASDVRASQYDLNSRIIVAGGGGGGGGCSAWGLDGGYATASDGGAGNGAVGVGGDATGNPSNGDVSSDDGGGGGGYAGGGGGYGPCMGGGGGSSYALGTSISTNAGLNAGDGSITISYTFSPSSDPTGQPSSYPSTVPSSAPTIENEVWGQEAWDKQRNRRGGLCENSCSGHGTCQFNTNCHCFSGLDSEADWTGPDCSLRTCPKGLAWVGSVVNSNDLHPLVECSNKGLCNRRTGSCECFEAYDGVACQRSVCPNNCNDHGTCWPEKYFAEKASRTYVLPWDALKQVGCMCDAGYRGPACEYRECPSGRDPQSGFGNEAGRECSGRGICEYNKGTCSCFTGFYGTRCEMKQKIF